MPASTLYLDRWLMAATLYTPGANLASLILSSQFVALCIYGTSLIRPKTLTDTFTAQANKFRGYRVCLGINPRPWLAARSSQFASNISICKPLAVSGCPVDLKPRPEELLFFLFFVFVFVFVFALS